jgi:hypothetical protein
LVNGNPLLPGSSPVRQSETGLMVILLSRLCFGTMPGIPYYYSRGFLPVIPS